MKQLRQPTILVQGVALTDLMQELRAMVREEIRTIPQPKKPSEYMNVDELSEFTHMARGAIYQGTSSKKIPFIKRGGKLLFKRSEIIAWLEESAQPVEQ